MLLTMVCLYNWANWDTGVVKQVSARGLETWTQNAYSERTFSESLRKLEWMNWITRHHRRGSHKSYAVTIHNYKITDDAGKVQVINPRDIVTYNEFPSGSRDEASSEGSDEASDEASDETSDRTSLKPNLKTQSQNESENEELVSKLASSVPPLATLANGGTTIPAPPAVPTLEENSNPVGSLGVAAGQDQKQTPDRDAVIEVGFVMAKVFGLEYCTGEHGAALEDILLTLTSLRRDASWLLRFGLWVRKNKFWKTRATTIELLAKFMNNANEGGVVAQFVAQEYLLGDEAQQVMVAHRVGA